jgi:hypothetical protein
MFGLLKAFTILLECHYPLSDTLSSQVKCKENLVGVQGTFLYSVTRLNPTID